MFLFKLKCNKCDEFYRFAYLTPEAAKKAKEEHEKKQKGHKVKPADGVPAMMF